VRQSVVRSGWLVVAATFVLAACGDEQIGRPNEAASALPDCQEVWVDGQQLDADYSGCLRGGRVVKPNLRDCTNDVGNQLAIYNKRFFAVLGGQITEVHDGPRTATTVAC
jgi:hypothetical protein